MPQGVGRASTKRKRARDTSLAKTKGSLNGENRSSSAEDAVALAQKNWRGSRCRKKEQQRTMSALADESALLVDAISAWLNAPVPLQRIESDLRRLATATSSLSQANETTATTNAVHPGKKSPAAPCTCRISTKRMERLNQLLRFFRIREHDDDIAVFASLLKSLQHLVPCPMQRAALVCRPLLHLLRHFQAFMDHAKGKASTDADPAPPV